MTSQVAEDSKNRELYEGLVISHLGKGLAIESEAGDIIICHTRRRMETAAAGDRVLWQPTKGGLGRVESILPRRSLLARPARNGKFRPVAANLDQLLIIFAIKPECDFLLIDQYLVVAENRGFQVSLIFNKIDLCNEKQLGDITERLSLYENLKYPIFFVSTKSGKGMDQIHQTLKGKTSMLVGQSGVGKSSMSNYLLPDKALKTGALSKTSGRGRQTTTAATLYHLPDGGDLIDSPGVSIFGLADISKADLAFGFREFQPHLNHCQFNDCKHINDKGCAIRLALENCEIDHSRYERFLKLREKLPTIS